MRSCNIQTCPKEANNFSKNNSNSNDKDQDQPCEQNEANRLAPYNPTHATAQSAALDLLQLTHADVFFDLGCGDGRLILAALDRCYNNTDTDGGDDDDDYQVERFARLHLQQQQQHSSEMYDEEVHPLQKPQTKPKTTANNVHQQAPQPQPPPPKQKSHIRKKSVGWSNNHHDSFVSNNQQHNRSSSVLSTDGSIPHLMRSASQDDMSETSGSLFSRSSDRTAGSRSSNRRESVDRSVDRSDRNDTRSGTGEEEDVDSAQPSPSSQHNKGGMFLPNSPKTPIMNNLKSSSLQEEAFSFQENNMERNDDSFPKLPHHDDESDDNGSDDDDDDDDNDSQTKQQGVGVPMTITTPKASPDGKSSHTPQISELPNGSILIGDTLATEQILWSIPFEDMLEVNNSSLFKKLCHDDDDNGGRKNEEEGNVTNKSRVKLFDGSNGASGGILLNGGGRGEEQQRGRMIMQPMRGRRMHYGMIGLQCVGIEYNERLAETAQEKLQQSHLYQHVGNNVCIRHGDVLDEWHRDNPERDNTRGNGHDDDGCDANKLSLLNDATAVFVYLLPQGLKKVKPLLYEAAARRHNDQGQLQQWKEILQHNERPQKEQQQWKLAETETMQQDDEMMHPLRVPSLRHPYPLQQQPLLHDNNINNNIYSTEAGAAAELEAVPSGEEISLPDPFPLPHHLQNLHCKRFSHISDITDVDQLHQNHTKRLSRISDITDVDFSSFQQHSNNSRRHLFATTEAAAADYDSYNNSRRQLLMQAHHKGISHMSDLTDVDFQSASRLNSLERILDQDKDVDAVDVDDDAFIQHHHRHATIGAGGKPSTTNPASENDDFTTIIPSFRVVSYMFSIPGWTPTKVDRSSKGNCPLYLYENIHEEEEEVDCSR